jgi:Sec-independent protein secretion pathway component TatC
LICSLPIVIREIFGFISPALYPVKGNAELDNTDVRNTNTEEGAAQGNVRQTRKEDGKKRKRSFSKIDLFKIISPMFVLFIFGVVFSYVLVIPLTLDFLYKYGESIGAETLLTVNDFIAFVMQFILAFGIAFQLPVLMYALSLSGLTDSKFWQRNFRYAIIIITVFGAIITPDGTGVTMWFIALPMIGLYAVGIIAIRRKEVHAITL